MRVIWAATRETETSRRHRPSPLPLLGQLSDPPASPEASRSDRKGFRVTDSGRCCRWGTLPAFGIGQSAGSDKPSLIGVDHDLDSVSNAKFLQDSCDVRLGGCVGDDQAIADFGV